MVGYITDIKVEEIEVLVNKSMTSFLGHSEKLSDSSTCVEIFIH